MNSFKKSLDNGFSVMGIVFILLILISLILRKPELLSENRVYFLSLFIVLVLSKYFVFKNKN